MTVSFGTLAYVLVVGFCISKALASAYRCSRALQTLGGEGLAGYDATSAGRYARNPLLFFREGALTRNWRLVMTPQADQGIEKSRVATQRWGMIAPLAVILALPLL